jgi:hypothetical protein
VTKSKASNSGRFKPGASGNPKGRPKKAADVHTSAFDIIIDRTLTITRNGRAQEVSVEEALQHRTYQDAIAGKRLAQREVLKWIKKREAWNTANSGPQRWTGGVKYALEPLNANMALLILGIATCNDDPIYGPDDPYERLLLETWAIEAALDRRRSADPLTAAEIEDIRRSARDKDALSLLGKAPPGRSWPKELWPEESWE